MGYGYWNEVPGKFLFGSKFTHILDKHVAYFVSGRQKSTLTWLYLTIDQQTWLKAITKLQKMT